MDLLTNLLSTPPLKKTKPLTDAALQTLAVIAYKQPITRAKIDSIRGVNSEGALRTLLDRNLIQSIGRAEEPGRPLLYGTTQEFLVYFRLGTLDDLPREKDFPRTSLTEEVTDAQQTSGH